MTLSPKTLTSITPRARSTSRVKISLIAFDRALTSIAQIPSITGGFPFSRGNGKSEPASDTGDEDLVMTELDLGDGLSGELNKDVSFLAGRSQCMAPRPPR